MGLLDFNPHDPTTIQRQLRERGDEMSDRAATAIGDLLNQVRALERTRDDIRRQVEPWGLAMHRLVYVVGAYLQHHRVRVVPAYRDAMVYLLDRAEKAIAASTMDSLLPPAPPPPQSMSAVPSAEWKAARKRRETGTRKGLARP